MKSVLNQALLFAGVVAISSPAMASLALVPGDLAIAFYSVDGSNVVGANTYVVNIGQASLYRENTQNGVLLSTVNSGLASSNIGTDLVTTFGANWASSGEVRWLLIGGTGPSDGTVAGDPARTIYESRGRASIAAGDTTPNTSFAFLSSGNRGTLSTQFSTFRDGINSGINFDNSNTSTSGVNVAGVTIPISNSQSMDEFLPPVTATYFGVAGDPRQTFATGAIAGGTTLEGALDVYRVIHSATGADLTAGMSAGNATLGNGQYIGSFTIDGSGNLMVGVVPEPSSLMFLGLGGTAALLRRQRRTVQSA